jgi:hypothetical protein
MLAAIVLSLIEKGIYSSSYRRPHINLNRVAHRALIENTGGLCAGGYGISGQSVLAGQWPPITERHQLDPQHSCGS